MTRNEVLHKVIEIINEHKSADSPEATENSRLSEDLGLDSLDIVEYWMYIETEFDLHFAYDGPHQENVISVKDMVDLLCKRYIQVVDIQKNVEKPVAKPIRPQNPEVEKLKGVDLSKLAGKPVQLNGYEIVVRKIAETQQNKR